jgi:ABC-type transporter Mla MlaB component
LPAKPVSIQEVSAHEPSPAVIALCERTRRLLEHGDAAIVICDLDAVAELDAVAVEALARLQLTARRLGRSIELRHAPRELQELLAFAGLEDVLPYESS